MSAARKLNEKEKSYVDRTLSIIMQEAEKLPPEEVEPYLKLMTEMYESRSITQIQKLAGLKKGHIVDFDTFVEHPDYLNMKGELFPKVMTAARELNSGKYSEGVLTGAIGVGKTTIGLITQAYQLYLLSRYENPQLLYSLAKSSSIYFIFQNISAGLSKEVDFAAFKAMMEDSKYFREQFPFDPNIKSQLHFPSRIIIKHVSGDATATIGQNVFSGIIDEVNFMAQTENSKKASDGGDYDQAMELYSAIAARRQSRFSQNGILPGVLCLVSSKRYPGQFTDQKIDEANEEIARDGYTRIYVYDYPIWEVLPKNKMAEKTFPVFAGDDFRKPRIMDPDEKVHRNDIDLVIWPPENYRSIFEGDIMRALRDFAGMSTLSRHPFLPDREKVSACFGVVPSIATESRTENFVFPKVKLASNRVANWDMDRFVHIDLAISGDSAGVAVGHCPRFETIRRGDVIETLPVIRFDLTLEVAPEKGGEIEFEKIRKLLYVLRGMGVKLKYVTLDSFQSTDTIQILRNQGFIAYQYSLDKTTEGYDYTKTAFYDGRIEAPEHLHAMQEFFSLERDQKKGKIDHPPNGSKDVADAMAGVVRNITCKRETWVRHGVSLHNVPESIKRIMIRTEGG